VFSTLYETLRTGLKMASTGMSPIGASAARFVPAAT